MKHIAIVDIGTHADGHATATPVAATIAAEVQGTVIARREVAAVWGDYDAFVFVGAMGICVRTIAPLIADKYSDPAVVCIDSLGRHAVAVLAGHVGGADELAYMVAGAVGARPVVTTYTDNAGLWPLDTFARQWGWEVECDDMNACIFAFARGESTVLLADVACAGTDALLRTLPPHVTVANSEADITPERFALAIVVSHRCIALPAGMKVVHYVPRVLTVGYGLARQAAPVADIVAGMQSCLHEHGLKETAIRNWCTIDVKADEPFTRHLREHGQQVCLFTSAQLAVVPVPNPNQQVAAHVGTPSVAEAAAIAGAGGGVLLMEKRKGANYTIAVAMDSDNMVQRDGGRIDIVGAGPGDPELISVRGQRLIAEADLILYAGSLVPRAITDGHKAGAVVRSSAGMHLQEQCSLMHDFYRRGLRVVRLHTGDPCIFGAIEEQMRYFDAHGMRYRITPGISSFLAAAACLRSQFTIPGGTQTIVLTRGEGRTPMPPTEQLHLLARSQSTMCIFLSAAVVDDVQRQLLMEYPADTPVAACYRLTWPDQRILRGRLDHLAAMVHDAGLTLTTMLVVGKAIDNREGASLLYSPHFSHLFRKGDDSNPQA